MEHNVHPAGGFFIVDTIDGDKVTFQINDRRTGEILVRLVMTSRDAAWLGNQLTRHALIARLEPTGEA